MAFPVPSIMQTLRNPIFLSIGHNLDGKSSGAKLRDLDSHSGAAGPSTPAPWLWNEEGRLHHYKGLFHIQQYESEVLL